MTKLKRPVPAVLLAWLAMLGFDFFLHGGLLASLYFAEDSFILSPLEAFRRIPIGYLGFLLLAIFLVWVVPLFNFDNWKQAFWLGIKLGAILWGGFLLGLISISTIAFSLALGWFLGQTMELGIGGAVVAMASKGSSLRRLTLIIVSFVICAIVATIVLQSTGVVPALRIQ